MAGGSIFAGLYGEPYNIKDNHTKLGIGITYFFAFLLIIFIGDPYKGLIISQMVLSIQLPFTVFIQIYLTSSKKVMRKYVNTWRTTTILILIAIIVTFLNLWLLYSLFFEGGF
jgi:manganese transport protein